MSVLDGQAETEQFRTTTVRPASAIYIYNYIYVHNTLQIRITLASDDVPTIIILLINRYASSSIRTRNHCPISEHVLPEQSPLVISYYNNTEPLRYNILSVSIHCARLISNIIYHNLSIYLPKN
jgi:hypothetical protein